MRRRCIQVRRLAASLPRLLVLTASLVLVAPGAALAADTLSPDGVLPSGGHIDSTDGHYTLVMQPAGNLVLYLLNRNGANRALWSTPTAGNPGARALLQPDGNLVVYSSKGLALWSSNTSLAGCSRLVLQRDGNLVLYNSDGAVWSTGTIPTRLRPNDALSPGQEIFSPPPERYRLVMQTDGNLVWYKTVTGKAVWSSATNGHPGAWAVMQADGNLVVYQGSKALWATGTNGNPGASLAAQNDGNTVIYSSAGRALWASHTVQETAPPPLPPAAKAPVACPAPVSTAPPSPPSRPGRVHARVRLNAILRGGLADLLSVRILRLPRHGKVIVRCRGRGCRHGRVMIHPSHARRRRVLARDARLHARRIVGRLLHGGELHAGDRLLFTLTAPGLVAERLEFVILRNRIAWHYR